MAKEKESRTADGKIVHYSVGAVIRQGDKLLLIDRAFPPYGFAGLAGHVDEGEEPDEALKREVKEESGLTVNRLRLIREENVPWNTCSKGIGIHYWYMYECEVSGDVKKDDTEAKSIGWYGTEDIKKLSLEPVWDYWFKKCNIV